MISMAEKHVSLLNGLNIKLLAISNYQVISAMTHIFLV